MTVINRLYTTTLILIGTTLLAMYIAVLLGYQGFVLLNDIELPYFILYPLCFLIFFLQFYLFSGIIWNIHGKRLFKLTACYAPIYVISEFVIGISAWTNFVFPVIYWIMVALVFNSFNGRKKHLFKLTLIFWVYTIVISWLRTEVLLINYVNAPIYQVIILSTDITILLIILYGKEYIHYVESSNFLVKQGPDIMENYVPVNPSVEPKHHAYSKDFEEMQSLVGWERTIASVVWIGWQILAWIGILVVAHFVGNVLFEALLISTAYAAYGYTIRYRIHFVHCTVVSGIIFFVAARAVPSVYYSQLIPILLALILVYGAFRSAVHMDTYNALKLKLEQFTGQLSAWQTFKLHKYCDYTKMKEIAGYKGLNAKQVKLLKLYYCDNANWTQINVAMSPWSESTTRKYLKQAKTDFERSP